MHNPLVKNMDVEEMSLKWSAAIAVSAVAVEILVHNDTANPLRPILALWFLLICPGMAFVQLLNFRDFLYEIVLAVSLSLALDLIIASVLLYSGLWSPELILMVLIILSSIGVVCQLVQWLRQQAKRTAVL
jgi:O-antigen/teichoic acid export membrane protein